METTNLTAAYYQRYQIYLIEQSHGFLGYWKESTMKRLDRATWRTERHSPDEHILILFRHSAPAVFFLLFPLASWLLAMIYI
ncbi:hypothetical protein M413DRAFT_134947 [Hebeloma cylindrosporum]|uniref:Uncharacterized protein n=1 Tax=Hebeloma cylindrosporum TaxID=76867 RepID=A0A0C3CFS5_HEBCY|nr:hypothetical protein M413DRAFT_134947 [Hebeloma cylindrosporum h7]